MKHTVQTIKENMMLIEQKLERYSGKPDACPVVVNKLKHELDILYIDLLQCIEDENNGVL